MGPGGKSMPFDRCYQIPCRAKSIGRKSAGHLWEEVILPMTPERVVDFLQPMLQLGMWDQGH